jgi:hypothetical protein
VAAQLAAFQKGLGSMELVTDKRNTSIQHQQITIISYSTVQVTIRLTDGSTDHTTISTPVYQETAAPSTTSHYKTIHILTEDRNQELCSDIHQAIHITLNYTKNKEHRFTIAILTNISSLCPHFK